MPRHDFEASASGKLQKFLGSSPLAAVFQSCKVSKEFPLAALFQSFKVCKEFPLAAAIARAQN